MRNYFFGLLLLLGLVACVAPVGDGGTSASPAPVLPSDLEPYRTSTPVPTLTPIPPLIEILLPTPTPATYTVKSGDTMGAIAQRYGVTLDALVTANPGLNANILSIGTVLIIPIGSVPSVPPPTPAALTVRQARCWPETSGGMWCFALAQNEYGAPLENLSAQFTLLDSTGNAITSQIAFGLLDILSAGEAMPFAVHFPPPVDSSLVPRVQVLTAILLLPNDTRYLPVALQNILVQVDSSGRTAQVSGQAVSTGSASANTLWVLGTAYDVNGNVVGVRRWEASSVLEAGGNMLFSFTVSSVGPAIDHVDLLVEAKAVKNQGESRKRLALVFSSTTDSMFDREIPFQRNVNRCQNISFDIRFDQNI
jgi:hypothetical protein